MCFLSPAANNRTHTIAFGDSNNNNAGKIQYNHSTDDLTLTASDNIILSGDAVGIGTTSPSAALHIEAGGNNLRLTRSSFDAMQFGIGTVSNIHGLHLSNITDNNTPISISEGAGANAFVLASGGNVGIGTASPSAQLEIEGNVSSATQFSGFQGLRIQNANGAALGRTADINFVAGTGSNNRGAAIGVEIVSGFGNDLYFATNPNNVSSNDTLVERMRIDSSGRVGIGTNNPPAAVHLHYGTDPSLNIFSTQHTQNTGSKINFGVGQSASSGGNTGCRIEHNIPNAGGAMSGELKFYTNNGDSLQERLRIQAGGGISFNGDSAAANALSDYEEGTFTGGFNDFNGTYSQNTGTYTKIGNVVTIQIMIQGSGGSGSGALILTSLPFNSEGSPSTYRAVGVVHAHTGLVTGGVQIIGLMNNNENKVRIRTVQNNATTTDLNRNGLNSGGFEVVIGITYQTAS